MKSRHCFSLLRTAATVMAMLAVAAPVLSAPVGESISIEELLSAGWEIAGYTSTFDNRSAFILFKHPNESYLVQCRAGYDVTRSPRTYSNCYELH